MQVTAFKAKDGSLHEFKEDQLIRDNELLLAEGTKILANDMAENAPYSDDWRAKALSGTDDMKYALELMMRDNLALVKSVVHQQEKLNILKEAKAKSVKIEKKPVSDELARPAKKKKKVAS